MMVDLFTLLSDSEVDDGRFITLLFDSEVDDGRFGGDLGGVVRVAELRRDVEPEVIVILHLLVS